MQLREITLLTQKAAAKTFNQVERYARLERILAFICMLVPAAFILLDEGNIRYSISCYYNMDNNQFYYFPLTVASMLFIVNGVMKKKHWYNTFLGIMLAGVILFNQNDSSLAHYICAVSFFAGNAVVILVFSPKKELWFKILIVALIILALLGYGVFHWFKLFWAEWISFALISIHYILESWGIID